MLFRSLFTLVLLVLSLPGAAATDTRQLLQLAEYIGVDYSEAVADGRIVNQAEYREMQDFSAMLVSQGSDLPPAADRQAFQATADELQAAVESKASLAEIQALTGRMRQLLLEASPQLSLPDRLLPTKQTAGLFQQHCSGCHGATGQGDGPMAEGLEPPPTNFTDAERAMKRSVLGLYDAISEGIDGTAMPSFRQFSDQERWSLAFYAGGLAFSGQPAKTSNLSLQEFVSNSPETLARLHPTLSVEELQALRANPQTLLSAAVENDPLAVARMRIQESYRAYEAGDRQQAQTLAVSAYLDGFELSENALDAYDPEFRREMETQLLGFRELIRKGDDAAVLAARDNILKGLTQARDLLTGSNLSNTTLFVTSLIILLREGLEAVLVVLALSMVLVRTQRRDALKYVHSGWIAALLAGAATWLVARFVFTISGASREIMEGVAALLAAGILFYVGFWMHSKTSAARWQAYIKEHVDRHLKRGTLWGIGALAFVAVYREVFETVLFYQSLLAQSAPGQYGSVGFGFLTGAAILAAISWAMVRYSLKLPVGKFFGVTSYLMLVLSFILMGKGIAALQEAAVLKSSPFPVNISLDWLGIHPTWEGVLAQLTVLLAGLLLLLAFRFAWRPPLQNKAQKQSGS